MARRGQEMMPRLEEECVVQIVDPVFSTAKGGRVGGVRVWNAARIDHRHGHGHERVGNRTTRDLGPGTRDLHICEIRQKSTKKNPGTFSNGQVNDVCS